MDKDGAGNIENGLEIILNADIASFFIHNRLVSIQTERETGDPKGIAVIVLKVAQPYLQKIHLIE